MTFSRTTRLPTGRPLFALRLNVAPQCMVLSFQVRCLPRDTSRTGNHAPHNTKNQPEHSGCQAIDASANKTNMFPAEWLAFTTVTAKCGAGTVRRTAGALRWITPRSGGADYQHGHRLRYDRCRRGPRGSEFARRLSARGLDVMVLEASDGMAGVCGRMKCVGFRLGDSRSVNRLPGSSSSAGLGALDLRRSTRVR